MLTLSLSYGRLAGIQAAFWGDPVTSGSPHFDYFFSLDPRPSTSTSASEVKLAASSYSEQLVRFDVVNTAHIVSDLPSHLDRPWTSLSSLLGGQGRGREGAFFHQATYVSGWYKSNNNN